MQTNTSAINTGISGATHETIRKAYGQASRQIIDDHLYDIKFVEDNTENDTDAIRSSLSSNLSERARQISDSIQVAVASEIGIALLEMQRSEGWEHSKGVDSLDSLLRRMGEGCSWEAWIELRIIRQAVEALTRDPSRTPWELTWINHLCWLAQIELLDGHPSDGRIPLHELYGRVTQVLVAKWDKVEEKAAQGSNAEGTAGEG